LRATPQPKRIWVLDRGMVSEENIEFLRERGARYLVGTPRSQLRTFEAALLDKADWAEVQPGVEVKLVAHPDGAEGEQYVLCRSSARREKELAMLPRASASGCARSSTAPMPPCSAAPPKTPERSNGASAAGWDVTPPPSACSKCASSATQKAAPVD
jgi:hypothetical protein